MTYISRYDFAGLDEWNRIRGWFSIEKAIAMQRYVRRLPAGSRLVELGSYEGRSSVALAAVIPKDSVLYCVDHFEGSTEHHEVRLDVGGIFESFLRNIERCGVRDTIRVLRSNTIDAANQFADDSIDLLLHDASHDFDSVVADLRVWYPKLKPHGWLFCDDYEEQWKGVIDAVEHLGLTGHVEARSLWAHQKPLA
ncbi:MAG TPA: class I SAM-dependent methyltransferase [Pirellulaceae bacterium]|nr:class I SAM-dependent methyltransferase [Pirellulaceae bacterium]